MSKKQYRKQKTRKPPQGKKKQSLADRSAEARAAQLASQARPPSNTSAPRGR